MESCMIEKLHNGALLVVLKEDDQNTMNVIVTVIIQIHAVKAKPNLI